MKNLLIALIVLIPILGSSQILSVYTFPDTFPVGCYYPGISCADWISETVPLPKGPVEVTLYPTSDTRYVAAVMSSTLDTLFDEVCVYPLPQGQAEKICYVNGNRRLVFAPRKRTDHISYMLTDIQVCEEKPRVLCPPTGIGKPPATAKPAGFAFDPITGDFRKMSYKEFTRQRELPIYYNGKEKIMLNQR